MGGDSEGSLSVKQWKDAAGRIPCAPLLLSLAAVVIFAIPGAGEALQFDRSRLLDGWRWLTCHWTHGSYSHLAWDVLVFAALASFCERVSRRRFWVCLGLAVVAIPVSIWLILPSLATYRGLSGLDSALFALAAGELLRSSIHRERWIVAFGGTAFLLLFLGKIGFEMATESTIFVDSAAAGLVPVPLAHAVGALIGLICAWAEPFQRSAMTPALRR